MADEPLASGKQLGPFLLDRRLALGGMAEIWLAEEQTSTGPREIALKVLLAPYAKDETFRNMFSDEVSIAARLTHENIVQIYGSYDLEGHLLQAMEVVDGKDLRRILSQIARSGEIFPVPLALLLAREVARALAYAHSKRSDDGKPLEIVHRDISPHNVMITRAGGVKVLDFGIASAAERLTRTRTGVIKGKIAYMAPEQALALGVSARTDIFALGIVLWEMLAMQRLFKAESDAMVLERVVKAEVPPIREHNPLVPEEAGALLAQMLQQRAANRPESMQAVYNGLNRILMRHFKEEQTSTWALSAWASNYLDAEPKKTGRYVPPVLLPSMQEDAPDAPTRSDLSGPQELASIEATQAMKAADPLGASGGTSVGDLQPEGNTNPEMNLPMETGLDPTLRVSSTELSLAQGAPTIPVRSEDLRSASRIGQVPTIALPHVENEPRLPRRSEIIRSVDAVPTVPQMMDPAALAARVAIPHIYDPETERDLEDKAAAAKIHVRDEGRVASGRVVGGEVTIPPKVIKKTIAVGSKDATPAEAPTKPPLEPWGDSSDENDFKPVKVGFTDAMRALDPAARRSDAQLEVPPEVRYVQHPPASVPRWVYPTFAAFMLVIVVLLVLLILK